MANVEALRDEIIRRAADPAGALGGKFNPNDLHVRLAKQLGGEPPVGRATLYSWFGRGGKPSQSLLELVPAFAQILKVREYELWQAAEILPPEAEASLALGSAAHDLRAAHRLMSKTLSQNGLSTAGEALVVDRILHEKLDYRMQVWPVVRGAAKPLHLHSWILLEPIPASESTQRSLTAMLENLPPSERRQYLREMVISDGLWRTLGLQWRNRIPEEYAGLGPEPLFIEVPVEERNRVAPPEPAHPRLEVDRILVLGPPWGHAELMSAILADALQFGSWDLRYLGFGTHEEEAARHRFCRMRLEDGRSRYVWAIALRYDEMERLRDHIVAAATPGALYVVMTFGPGLVEFGAQALSTKPERVQRAVDHLDRLAHDVADRCDVIRVHVADEDVLGDGTGSDVDSRDRMVDRVRYLTAEVLDVLRWQRNGPGLPLWGDRFEDLRHGDEASPLIPPGRSWVRWHPRGG